ncbi:hypothetical protein [Cellulomonas sp. URHB0016]
MSGPRPSAGTAAVLAWQRTAGNRAATTAVQRLLGFGKATSNRERIDAALASKDVSDVKAVDSFADASDPERDDLIRILLTQSWLGPRDESALERIWTSYSPLPEKAESRLATWDACRARGAELENIEPVRRLRAQFKDETTGWATGKLRTNEKVMLAELEKFGLTERWTPHFEVQNLTAGLPLNTAQLAALEGVRSLATLVRSCTRLEGDIRKNLVGKGFEPFDPARRPVDDFTIGDRSSWDFTFDYWQQVQTTKSLALNSSPAVYAAYTKGPSGLDVLVSSNPGNSQEMLFNIHQLVMLTLQQIRSSYDKIVVGDIDHRVLHEVHAALKQHHGATGATRWDSKFHSWVIRNDVAAYERKEAWKELGLKAVEFVAFMVAEYATMGGATWLLAVGTGLGAAAWNADRTAEQAGAIQDLAGAQVSADSAMVTKGQVDAAQAKALDAKLNLYLAAFNTVLGAARKAQAELAQPGAPRRSSGTPDNDTPPPKTTADGDLPDTAGPPEPKLLPPKGGTTRTRPRFDWQNETDLSGINHTAPRHAPWSTEPRTSKFTQEAWARIRELVNTTVENGTAGAFKSANGSAGSVYEHTFGEQVGIQGNKKMFSLRVVVDGTNNFVTAIPIK